MKTTKTVLLLEHEPDTVMLLRQAFRTHGLNESLRVVNDSAEAIEYLEGENAFDDRQRYPFPSLVLMDLNLGTRDGLDLLRWLRDHPDVREQLALVAWSSIDLPGLASKAYVLNANSVLAKPFEYDELVRVVGSIAHYWLQLNVLPQDVPKLGGSLCNRRPL
jgi:CheY-like chemotaxis protein